MVSKGRTDSLIRNLRLMVKNWGSVLMTREGFQLGWRCHQLPKAAEVEDRHSSGKTMISTLALPSELCGDSTLETGVACKCCSMPKLSEPRGAAGSDLPRPPGAVQGGRPADRAARTPGKRSQGRRHTGHCSSQ